MKKPRKAQNTRKVRELHGNHFALNTFMVSTGNLSTRQLADYREFVEFLYESPVCIRPTTDGQHDWLTIQHMTMSDAGLRVASWLYGIPEPQPITT